MVASYLSSLLLLLLQLGLEFVELFLGARGEGGGGLVSFGVLGWGVEGLEVGEEGKKGRGKGVRRKLGDWGKERKEKIGGTNLHFGGFALFVDGLDLFLDAVSVNPGG